MTKSDKAAEKRQQPDKPVGEPLTGEEEDFHERQRRESPDGMTPAERDQAQKGAPGSLDQTSPSGEHLGLETDEANPVGGKQQSSGKP